ncbi:MAG: hypothetical protein V1649_03780 [Patescibacteria group bacterium]
MQTKLHKNARTTLAIREQIRNSISIKSINYLAKKFNLSWNTVAKWKNSKDSEDKSSRPHKLNTTLTQEQEDLICFERKQFKKSLEDISFTLENEIPNLYPMKVYRCLKRHGLNILPSEFVGTERKIRKFRKYKMAIFTSISSTLQSLINKENMRIQL